ncbi:sigma-70 family RNA polymerase sigma factor [Echinicola soli]|uniref:Sigma-70 family RNA polymerase sigma factor n=1 Tax=Echinicola soli TaxID=2591634 RepID=A0A514CFT7_9BACT|nr:sigma-70 family RNA polymerase sigma factor [Echinicola soli]QDH78695.1 sigma-70 family RNA polymerase sigma factor [Echinicola soli]
MSLLHKSPVTPKSAATSNHSADHTAMGMDEGRLWDAFRRGSEEAFITIYKQYANILFNFGCQLTPDRDLVKDILQDFFIYLRHKRSHLGKTDAIKPYLIKSFKRRIVAALKKHHKYFSDEDGFEFKQFPVELSHETVYINRQIDREQLERLNGALQQLDSREREAIYYFYFEGLSYQEIAQVFEFSHVSSARRLVYRGLAHLRKFFVVYLLASFWGLKEW